jgi:hypothetical protein
MRGESSYAVLRCLYARPAQLLCSACGPLPFLLSHSSISYNNPQKIIYLLYTFALKQPVQCTQTGETYNHSNMDALCSRWLNY